jgi:hypothetical protein
MTLSLKGEGKQIYYLAGKKKKRVKENITNNNGGPRAAPTKPI